MNALEKLKLTQELKKAIDERNAQTNPLNKLVWVKKVQKLRQELGFFGSVPVQKQADDERNYVDSLVFNQDGKLLLVQRSSASDFMPNKWWFVGGGLEQGESYEQGARRELQEEVGIAPATISLIEKKELQGIGISYRFACVVDNDVLVQLQKSELQDYCWASLDELDDFELVGSLSDLNVVANKAIEQLGIVPHQQQTNQKQIYGDDVGVLSDDGIEQLDQAKVDDVQNMGESERQSTTSDNPIGAPITNRPNLPTTKNARQKANDLAIELVERINQNNLSRDDLTNDELTALAKFTGGGGGLINADGTKGSDYEYYTPKELASGVWDIAKELGFSGGKVLDPSAGTGIFTATSPDSALMDSVELDNTSGTIAKIVNDGKRSTTTISPFEAVAKDMADGDDADGYDLVITNVPFGDNKARGANKMLDVAYQKESLDYYFILRSLEKLKSGGLAVFITTPSTIHGKRKKQVELRQRTSRIAHFLGAYRLPNAMFANTGADVSVDVIAFQKYDDKTRATIANYYENGDITTLEASGIYWTDYLGGNYFKTRKSQILGDETQVPDWRDGSKTITKVLTSKSMAEVITEFRQFKRATNKIDWELLELNEPAAISYQMGDIIQKDGNSYQFDGVIWQQIQVDKSDDELIKEREYQELIRLLDGPYDVVVNDVHIDKMAQLMSWLQKTGQQSLLTARLTDIYKQAKGSNGAWLVLCAGAAIDMLIEQHGAGFAYLDEYRTFSDKFKDVMVLGESDKLQGMTKNAYKNVVMHHNNGKFSSLWRGAVDTQVAKLDENYTPQSILAKFQYENKSPYISMEQLKIVNPDVDVMADDDWFVVGDKAIHKNDFLVGNLADRLADIDIWLTYENLSDGMKAKLLRQRQLAISEAGNVNVRTLRYDLQSPLISANYKVDFLKTITPYAEVVDTDKGEKPFIRLPKVENDIDKLMNRIGVWLKNGGLSLGGAELSMSDKEAILWLNKTANSYNEQFNNWVKVNDRLLDELDARLNDPKNRYFSQNDDEAPMSIAGLSDKLTLHPHQNAFVRNQGRSFGGINGFSVGLGKTFSSLASIQHVHNIGTKQRTLIVVPKSVLSNWRKEAMAAYQSMEDCIFIGLRENGDKFTVKSALFDTDLTESLDGKYRKIFMSFEAFRRIRLMDKTFDDYHDHLRQTDKQYALSDKKKDNERALGRGAELKSILLQKGTNNAPYLEHMNIDSIVIDEAHAFKNSITATEVGRIRYLSNPSVSSRGLDAQIKTWYIRGLTAMKDGVQLLTATPITNSPTEIYSMLALAVGRERANAMSGGVWGVDDFVQLVCDTEYEDIKSVDNKDINVEVFTGLRNIHLLRSAIHNVATIKTADDVKDLSVVIPSRDEIATGVKIPNEIFDEIKRLQEAYGVAKSLLKGKHLRDFTPQMVSAYHHAKERFGESDELLAHPFNLIRKMEVMIADDEFLDGGSFYDFDEAQVKLVQKAIDEFNKKKYKNETARLSPYTDDAHVQTVTAKSGDDVFIKGYKYAVQAQIVEHRRRDRIVLDTLDGGIQAKFEDICDKLGVRLNITIPAKLSALLDNFKAEMTNKRGLNADGTNSPIVKQIIFCDYLFLHNKIVRLLSTMGGVPKDKIAIITGQINAEADEIIDIQNGFNEMGDDNRYQVIVANKKAEVGINLQKGTQAIHHLTTGWTPDSIEQRNGRGARQGNHTETVNIYYYDADGTFDSLKRNMVNKKDEWITSLLKGDGLSVVVASDLSDEDKDALISAVGDEDAIQNYLKQKQLSDEIARQNLATARQMVNVQTIYQNQDLLKRTYYDDVVDKVGEFTRTAVEFKKAKGFDTITIGYRDYQKVVDIKNKTQLKIYQRLENQFNDITSMLSVNGFNHKDKLTAFKDGYLQAENKLNFILEAMVRNGLGTTRSYGFGNKNNDDSKTKHLFYQILYDQHIPKSTNAYGMDESWINKDHKSYQLYQEKQEMAQKLINQAVAGIDEIAQTVGGILPVGAGELLAGGRATLIDNVLYQIGDVFSVDLNLSYNTLGEKAPHIAVISSITKDYAFFRAVNDIEGSFYKNTVRELTLGIHSDESQQRLQSVKLIKKDSSDYIIALKEMARLEMTLAQFEYLSEKTPYSDILPAVNEYKIVDDI